VSQKLLYSSNVLTILKQVRGKRMPQRMAARWFHDAGPPHSLVQRLLDDRLMHTMTMAKTGRRTL